MHVKKAYPLVVLFLVLSGSFGCSKKPKHKPEVLGPIPGSGAVTHPIGPVTAGIKMPYGFQYRNMKVVLSGYLMAPVRPHASRQSRIQIKMGFQVIEMQGFYASVQWRKMVRAESRSGDALPYGKAYAAKAPIPGKIQPHELQEWVIPFNPRMEDFPVTFTLGDGHVFKLELPEKI